MKKKMLLLAALAAATTAFTGCSSDEELAQAPVQAPETPEAPDEPQGTPLTVVVGNGATRADLTKDVSNLASFKLWGIQQTDPKVRWIDGKVFTGNNTDGWTSAGVVWPTTNKTTPTKFYGYADFSDLTDADVPGIDPAIGVSGQSFKYSLGDGVSSKLYFTQYTEAAIAEMREVDAETADIMQSLRDDNLNETVDAYQVADNSTMPDLMVTADGAEGTEGTDGTFSLNLKHALSNLRIRAKFNTSASGDVWQAGTTYYIEWIRVHGLYTSGTYTYGSGWTFDSETDNTIVYEKYFGEGVDHALAIPIQPYSNIAADGVTYTDLASLGEFMMIPQSFTPWTSSGISGTATEPSGVYLEFYGFIKKGDEVSFTDGQHFLPLTVTGSELVAGRAHTLVVDLTTATNAQGIYEATPAQFNE